jgi:hypothetical protein
VNGVNGVTHAEGIEQSDLSKLANDTPQRGVDEQSTLNGVGSTEPEVDLLAGEANVPEIYEHTAAEENTHEERESGLKESVIAERPGEIEGWQTWQTQEKDDETLPLALKDIQSAQQLQEDTTREAADAESGEEPGLALEKDVEGEISDTAEEEVRLDELASANTVEMSVVFEGEAGEHAGEASGTPTLPVDELSMIDTVEQIAVTATEISPTITIPASEKHEPKETPITQIGTGKAFAPTTAAMSEESTLLLEYQHISSHGENREETPTGRIAERPQIETLAGPPREIAPAPKKPGFWRRLFRFGRKKR